ncbi:MAG: hypothetical protein Fur0014_21330 [Rubrivivax sp.]
MHEYHQRRAAVCERAYVKPERRAELRAMEAALPPWLEALHARLAPGARVVVLDNRFVPGIGTPIPRPDQAIVLLGPRARPPRWTDWPHYRMLDHELA